MSVLPCYVWFLTKAAFTRAPDPESGFKSGSQSTWERWSESGFEFSLPPCNATSLDQDLDQNPRVNGAYVPHTVFSRPKITMKAFQLHFHETNCTCSH